MSVVFSDYFFVFNPDLDHGMMTCRDMFHMFSLTCLSCEKGAWHSIRSEFGGFSSQTLTRRTRYLGGGGSDSVWT